ncbi:MAG: hypothetical protein HEQ39_06415 [Rhizobacter sp.]
MNTQNLEKLMAYADGELADSDRAQVQAWLDRDPEARAALQAFSQTKPLLQSALVSVMQEPVPQRLLDAVRHSAAAPIQAQNLKPLPDQPQVLPSPSSAPKGVVTSAANRPTYWPQMATAASVALVMGLAGGHWWGGLPGGTQDLAAQQFQQIMQTAASGQAKPGGIQKITPLASFQSQNGQLCREYEQESGERLTHGVACKAKDQWVVVVAVDRGLAKDKATSAIEFTLAAGEADLLASAIKGLGMEAALLPHEELAWIEKGWKASP